MESKWKKKKKKTDFLQSGPSHETNAVVLSDRKRFLWWVKISPSLSRPTPSLRPCTWKARWRRPAASARPPNRVQNPPSLSGWGQQHRTPGRGASTSMGPGESWSGPHRAGDRFPDSLTVRLCRHAGIFQALKRFVYSLWLFLCSFIQTVMNRFNSNRWWE